MSEEFQKLVLCYTQGNGCSWSADETLPFLYESKEKAEYDLLTLWEETENKNDYVKFSGLELPLEYLTYYIEDKLHKRKIPQYSEPQIYTLEEWFAENLPEA